MWALTAHSHLKPGVGHIEQVEIDWKPRCDDGTLPQYPIVEWYEYLADATQRAQRPIAYQTDTRQMLEAAGFIDIRETVIRAPYNCWPVDKHQRKIGSWFLGAMAENYFRGLESLSMAPFTRIYKWPISEVKSFITSVEKMMAKKEVHGYNNMYERLRRAFYDR